MELKARSASVRARTTLELLSLDKEKFERYKSTIEETFHNILENRNYIRRVSLFKKLPGRETNSLAALFRSKEYKKDEAVIRQGEVGDKFYIVRNGLLQVFVKDGKGNERMTNEMGTEDFFGEIALLEDVKRTADVRIASETAVLFHIDKATFGMLTGIYPGLNIRLRNEIAERKKRTG
jgi:CRP-like cAMP-binding protein